jgi:hypothetical protein
LNPALEIGPGDEISESTFCFFSSFVSLTESESVGDKPGRIVFRYVLWTAVNLFGKGFAIESKPALYVSLSYAIYSRMLTLQRDHLRLAFPSFTPYRFVRTCEHHNDVTDFFFSQIPNLLRKLSFQGFV